MEHTPAPWKPISRRGLAPASYLINDEDGLPVATTWRAIDARLIAAAPELLAALIELNAWAINESGAALPAGTFELVQSVIAKARGEAIREEAA